MGEIIVLEEKLRNQRVQNKIRRNIFIKTIIKKGLHQLAIFRKPVKFQVPLDSC